MRSLALVSFALLFACEPDEGPGGIEQCPDCAVAPSCPGTQPEINPLMACEARDAECFYCSTVMRRFVCQGSADNEDDLKWRDNGVAEMCPPPSMDTGATGE